jgi:hypothetical protein
MRIGTGLEALLPGSAHTGVHPPPISDWAEAKEVFMSSGLGYVYETRSAVF